MPSTATAPPTALRTLIRGTPALQRELGAIDDADPARFLAVLAQVAASHGIAVSHETLSNALSSPRHGPSTPPVQSGLPPPEWLPTDVTDEAGIAVIEWAWFGKRELLEPFFYDDAAAAQRHPLSRLIRWRTPLDELVIDAPTPPAGLIFHLSRCGSTLAGRMIGALPGTIVVSEAQPIDAVVRRTDLPEDVHAALLAGIVGCYARRAPERQLILKLDCWHMPALALFQRALPGVPWIFLYRDPVEIIVSHARQPGVQMVPSFPPAAFLGVTWEGEPLTRFRAAILHAICQAALEAFEHDAEGGLLVDYRELPGAVVSTILPHFGISAVGQDERITAAAFYDVKRANTVFESDVAAKQAEASAEIRAAVASRLEDDYHALVRLRTRRQ